MGISHRKRIRRDVDFYRTVYGFREPFKVLADGNFLHMVLLSGQGEVQDVINKVCNSPMKVYSTRCVLHELQALGDEFQRTAEWARRVHVHKCGHKEPLSAADCLLRQIGMDNTDHWWLATQDRRLRECVSKVPCAPCWFYCAYGVELERPSEAALSTAKRRAEENMGIPERERKSEALRGLAALAKKKEVSKFRLNVPKGPNPLSCKRKHIKVRQGERQVAKEKKKRPRRKRRKADQ